MQTRGGRPRQTSNARVASLLARDNSIVRSYSGFGGPDEDDTDRWRVKFLRLDRRNGELRRHVTLCISPYHQDQVLGSERAI
jgi:hypothetical protein